MSFSEKIRNNGFVKLLSALEPIGVAVGLIGLGIAGYAFLQDMEGRKEERIARAWELLAIKMPGNSGKSDALRILHGYKVNLSNVDLSCEVMGGELRDKADLEGKLQDKNEVFLYFAATDDQSEGIESSCVGSPGLYDLELLEIKPWLWNFWNWTPPLIASGINLKGNTAQELSIKGATIESANFSYASMPMLDISETVAIDFLGEFSDFSEANFSKANLSSANFQRSNLANADLKETIASCADFAGANLQGVILNEDSSLSYSSFFMSRLLGVKLTLEVVESGDFSFANVSEVEFPSGTSKVSAKFGPMWAWSDWPPQPTGIANKLGIKLCDPKDREAYVDEFGLFKNLNWKLVPNNCGIAPDLKSTKKVEPDAPAVCSDATDN